MRLVRKTQKMEVQEGQTHETSLKQREFHEQRGKKFYSGQPPFVDWNLLTAELDSLQEEEEKRKADQVIANGFALTGAAIGALWLSDLIKGVRDEKKESASGRAQGERVFPSCCICESCPISCVIRPCGHSTSCISCIQRLLESEPVRQCPICRCKILSYEKIVLC